MKTIKYTKDNNDVSTRKVQPIGFIFDDRNKVMCLDLSQYYGEELIEMTLLSEKLHRQFLESMYASKLNSNIRTFFLDGISDVV